ncbi:Sterol 3-beta-glucosyltransferase [Zea mays]|uniref:Sterol 3-beta-glucosyltransferase n=1 Tax=Zea mays TaxID=4577 RepID=A0A1D6N6C8_MAIZE|nr:Sterol 3-beta-glucosyltransferase [Zea mays]
MGINGEEWEETVLGDGVGRRKGGAEASGLVASSSFAEGMGEFVLRSMDARFSGSVDDDEYVSSRQPVFGHSKSTATTSGTIKGQDNVFVRSYSDRLLKCDLTLDMLSENEKIKITERLVKIQNDGTVEVDVTRSALVASELSEIDAFGCVPHDIEEVTPGITKSVPKLKIAILVVGTRGDVQPFIALAKRLQEFGHYVRLATHVNFRTFVKSAGIDFYPLGGDPRVMAQYMTKNKGFFLAAPTEIAIQRKQLKEIIFSLLPACTEPDLDTGTPFRAQAIIANPPAYGHLHIAEALGAPLHIFFTFPWTPTNEFPHPLARMPQSATYRLSYLILDLIVWWGSRGFINDFRKKLNLPPIAYFSTYHGSISHLPTGYMWSPQLMPKPKDWGPLVDVVGYCFLNLGTKYQPPPQLSQWLQQGPKPIYIGFGSMVCTL